jgi:hypothetical protein
MIVAPQRQNFTLTSKYCCIFLGQPLKTGHKKAAWHGGVAEPGECPAPWGGGQA